MLCLPSVCLVILVFVLVLVREPPRRHTMSIPYYLGTPVFYPSDSAGFRGNFWENLRPRRPTKSLPMYVPFLVVLESGVLVPTSKSRQRVLRHIEMSREVNLHPEVL
jgi:hypothetical protein